MSRTISLIACLAPLVHCFGTVEQIEILTRQPTPLPTAAATAPPTYLPDPDMFAVSYEEYLDGAKCGQGVFKRNTCYTDSKGKSYRFGCKKDDPTKVYTDACEGGCAAANCQHDWKWLGDQANMCMIQERDTFFKYTCHAPEAVDGVVTETDTEPTYEPKTCNELGWSTLGGSDTVCAESAVVNGRCSGDTDQLTASQICAKLGARLCTADELSFDEAKGSGCKYDCSRSWSATKCTTTEGNPGYETLAGARKCSSLIPTRCDEPTVQTAVTRCCSDAGAGDAPTTESPQAYPLGYSPAVSMDYPIADGECGKSAPVDTYSCWKNPADGIFQRFACRPGSLMVWSQSCGTSDNCSLCQGNWFTQDEAIGTCYSTDVDTLYSYKCV